MRMGIVPARKRPCRFGRGAEKNVTLLNDGSQERAYTYFYNRDLDDYEPIICGDYRRYSLENSSDRQWYIAYGSNMSSERLKARIGEPCQIKYRIYRFRLLLSLCGISHFDRTIISA